MKWIVSTGPAKRKVVAEGERAFDACVAAVKAHEFPVMGVIMEAIPADETPTDDNTFYVSSEHVCKEAGMWAGD